MNNHLIRLPQLAWQGTRDLEITLPGRWEVSVCNMQGYRRRALTDAEIADRVRHPIAMAPLREMAKNRKQAVILFDDTTRATRIARIVPFVLEELAAAGIPDADISVLSPPPALMLPWTGSILSTNWVRNVLRRFPVFNHNAFGNWVDIGTTTHGIPLKVNAEVMSCDLKIGIGSVVPHSFAGFGGGAKIIIPGVCYFETCSGLHQMGMKYNREHPDSRVSLGTYADNVIRQDMQETARRVGLDMKIDAIINGYGETVALYARQPGEDL